MYFRRLHSKDSSHRPTGYPRSVPASQDGVLPSAGQWQSRLAVIGLFSSMLLLSGAFYQASYAVPASKLSVGQMSDLLEGQYALRAFDVPRARAIATALSASVKESPDGRLFLGRLAFYEGDYERAVKTFGDLTFMNSEGKVDDFPSYVARVGESVKGLTVKESPHFRVLYQADGPDRILIDYALDTLEKSYAVLSAELGHQSPEKIRVEIFPDSRRFIMASGLKGEEIETTGTVALCIYNKLMITSPRALALGYRWMDTLSHELTHLLIAQKSANTVPVWLQEGLAKYFEVRWRGGRGADMTPTSESLLAEALEADKLVPFERMSPSLAKLPSAEEAQLAFAQVQTVIEYILQKKGLAGIHKLVDEMRNGRSDRQAVEAVVGTDFATFTEQWRAFIKAKRLKKLPGIALLPTILQAQEVEKGEDAPEKIEDPFMAQNKRLREFSRLGDLMRERGRYKAALVEYNKARLASPIESPALSVKIALTWLENSEPAQARDILEQTVLRYNSFAPAWMTLATAQLKQGDVDAAHHSLSEANAINPFDPMVHRQLAVVYEARGQKDKSNQELRLLQDLFSKG